MSYFSIFKGIWNHDKGCVNWASHLFSQRICTKKSYIQYNQYFCIGYFSSIFGTPVYVNWPSHMFSQIIFSKKGGVIGEPWFPILLSYYKVIFIEPFFFDMQSNLFLFIFILYFRSQHKII
jgi:hypothetical protein